MSNILVVESKNDRIFIEAIVNHLNCNNFALNIEIVIDEYEDLDGLSEKKLILKLKNIQARSQKDIINKIGIIIDLDEHQEIDRIQFINTCVEQAFEICQPISKPKDFIQITTNYGENLHLACYFTNVNGQGELETVLKAIKTEDSPHADCLESWQKCIESKGKKSNKKTLINFG
ncbi:DUF3226 domain-containing protein [Gloeothece citriformis]|uniref:DUF3226 domain-containing protein n=1 Tax=Gloeothece citriformis TaxID=2546356 RepID=UPI000173D026|nr:DUF3226 domain-containing protein [Gloeothece citriformis]